MASRLVRLVVLAAALALVTTAVSAQVATSGRLTGVVMDATQAAVPGAQIVILDNATGATINTESGADGSFTVGNLKPANYTVRVTAQGFKTAEVRAVKIVVGQTFTLNVPLEVGEVQSTVTVEAGAEVLKTSETAIATTITGKAIQQLPFTSRDALDLGVLMPGAQTTGRPRNTSFMGLPKGSINITIDGINAQDNILKSSDGFFTTIRPRVDSIEEFSINTVAGGAEQAGEGAVQIRFETKRGSNDYHGGAWWYHRNDFLNSNYYFNNLAGLPRQRQRLNQFGYNIGGPVWKDKIFFFHAFDFYRKPDSRSRDRTILTDEATQGMYRYEPVDSSGNPLLPSAAQLTAAPWVTCNGNSAAPECVADIMAMAAAGGFTSAFDSQMAPIFAALRSAASAAGVGQLSPPSLFQESIRFTNFGGGNRWFPDVRFDWNITENHQFSAVYHYSKFRSTPDFLNSRDVTYPVAPFNTNQASQNSDRNQFTGQWRYNVSPTMSNMLIFGVVSAPVAFFNDMSPDIYPQISTNLGAIRVRPDLDLVNDPFLGFGAFPRNTALGQLSDTFSYVRGKHSMSFGFSATSIYGGLQSSDSVVGEVDFGISSSDPFSNELSSGNLPNTTSGDRSNVGNLYANLTGRINGYAAFVYVDLKSRQFVTGVPLFENYRQNEFGFFGTDSWRVAPTLTMNFGLRWEYQGSPYGEDNIYYSLAGGPDSVFGVSGAGNVFSPGATGGSIPTLELHGNGKWYKTDMNNFAPSLGLAWNPAFDAPWYNAIFGGPNKSVFRAGYSINYTREGTNNWLARVESNRGFFGDQFSSPVSPTSSLVGTPGFFAAGSLQFQNLSIQSVAQEPAAFVDSFLLDPSTGSSVNVFQGDLRVPYTQSWYFSVQREINPSTVLEVRYEGNHAPNLWRRTNLNETNIFENGFLQEFMNAQSNLAICQANVAACLAAAGQSPTSSRRYFSNLGLPGQVSVPILSAAFTGSATGSQTDSDFRSGTFISNLQNGLAGSMANTLAGSLTFWPSLTSAIDPSTGQPFPENFFRVNPHARGGAFVLANGAHSTYNSLVVELRRRLANGLQFQGNYVWSHSITNFIAVSSSSVDTLDTIRDPGRDKSPAPFDLRHAFKFQGIYELPFGPGKRWSSEHGWLNRIIEGWELSSILRWQSGRVTQITSGLGGTFNQNDGGVVLNGITSHQLQNMLKVRKTSDGKVFWFPDSMIASSGRADEAFIAPCRSPGEFCQRLFVQGPQFFRPDINIVKNTKITERVNIQFRAEFLNAFNNANFLFGGTAAAGTTAVSTQSTSFGRITNAYQDTSTTDDPGGRIIQFVVRVSF